MIGIDVLRATVPPHRLDIQEGAADLIEDLVRLYGYNRLPATLLADQSRNVALFDANDSSFRNKEGIIPGAKLLSSFNHYDIQKELPADKNAPVVFYCTDRL